jgi:putative transposase
LSAEDEDSGLVTMDAWAHKNGVRMDFIRPGKPVGNAFIESFNGKLRDEFLNTRLFFLLEEAKEKFEEWRKDYNLFRPHSAIGNLAPVEFAEQARKQAEKAASLKSESVQ